MKIFSIEFDEYEKAALLTAIENDHDRLRSLKDRVILADSKKAVPHPAESGIRVNEKGELVAVVTHKAPAQEPEKPAPPPAWVPTPEPEPAIEEEDDEAEEETVAAKPLGKSGEKKARVLALKAAGKTVPEIAEEIGCTKAYAYMLLKEARDQAGEPSSKPAPLGTPKEAEVEPEEENDAAATESEEDEEAAPKDAPKQDEEQAFACRECGNARMEPYGTNPLALFCPNELGDDGDKHIYEVKADD